MRVVLQGARVASVVCQADFSPRPPGSAVRRAKAAVIRWAPSASGDLRPSPSQSALS